MSVAQSNLLAGACNELNGRVISAQNVDINADSRRSQTENQNHLAVDSHQSSSTFA